MKLFWLKNKVLLVTLAAVLALGVIFWGGLSLFEGKQMQDAFVRTSAAEAEAAPTSVPNEMPVPTAVPTALPAEQISADILGLEWRYRSVFPRISNTMPYEAKSWKEGEKVADSLAVTAITRTGELYEQLLGRTLDLTTISVTRYVDEKGYRPNVLRLTDEKNDFVCVLLEKDLSLLVADNGVFSASEKMDLKRDGAAVAECLGTTWTGKTRQQGSTSRGGKLQSVETAFELSDGRWVTLGHTGNTLHGVQVHADEKCMEENVCFPADITMNEEVVHLVAPQNFVQGDLNAIAEGDMSVAEVTALYRRFLSAANGRASERRDLEGKTMDQLDYNLQEGQITYYLDKSGYRENFYHIHHNDYIDVDIAAKSGYIVRADCKELYNTDDDLNLTHIDYDHMGGVEYFHYVRYVAEQTWGKENVKEVDVNAVYDGNFCTIDAYMTDGRMYEFFFAGGRMTQIEHYFQDYYAGFVMPGWAADSLYVNTVTGEEFYQEW